MKPLICILAEAKPQEFIHIPKEAAGFFAVLVLGFLFLVLLCGAVQGSTPGDED